VGKRRRSLPSDAKQYITGTQHEITILLTLSGRVDDKCPACDRVGNCQEIVLTFDMSIMFLYHELANRLETECRYFLD
jgi:hypothetical protein